MSAEAPEAAERVPVWANVHLTHAALQAVADEEQIDILHIKGPTDAAFRTAIHTSTDADVLVRPSQLSAFIEALAARGWAEYSGFDDGSPFGHAANYEHPDWSWVDVHRAIPGFRMSAGDVFDRLWREHAIVEIGRWPCTVPSPRAQVLIQTVHVARSHGADKPETWTNCPGELRPAVRALAEELGAQTAFAAGIGELELHRGNDDYELWKYWSGTEEDRLAEWFVRLRTADGIRARLSVLTQMLRVNRTHLRLRLGREPRLRDVAREQFARIGKALTATARLLIRSTHRDR